MKVCDYCGLPLTDEEAHELYRKLGVAEEALQEILEWPGHAVPVAKRAIDDMGTVPIRIEEEPHDGSRNLAQSAVGSGARTGPAGVHGTQRGE